MTYHRQNRVEFNHCDPAGIVFYPRYFEMLNSVIENFFRDIVELPFELMMETREGVPTAQIQIIFSAPSRLGDVLDWQLKVTKVGGSSLGLVLMAEGAGEIRLRAEYTLVYVTAKGRPQPWPEGARQRLTAFMEAA